MIETDPNIRNVPVGSDGDKWVAVRYAPGKWSVLLDEEERKYLSLKSAVYYVTPDQIFFEQHAVGSLRRIHEMCGINFQKLPPEYRI